MKIGTVYDITFSTTKVDTGVATNADSLPIVRITENWSLLAYTPSVSNLTTWLYIVTIDSSLANGFEVDKRYTVYATATVNGIAGAEWLDSFTIDRGSTPEEIYTYFTTDNREYAFKWAWGWWIIDTTKKHEEIIEKYEKLIKEELKKIINSIPKTDISAVITAISQIPKVSLDDIILALSALRWQIKVFNTTIKNDYISERNRIEVEFKSEIDKKNSLLLENEYNLKQKEEKITSLTESIESLSETIEKMNEEHEEELKIVDDTYIWEISETKDRVKRETEEEIVEKIIPLLP